MDFKDAEIKKIIIVANNKMKNYLKIWTKKE
jgi:hypothetical protein